MDMTQETDLRERWVEVFQEFDTNEDGELCKDEIKNLMRICETNPTDDDVDTYIKEADKNDDMKISCEEFCQFMEKQLAQGDPEAILREAFEYYDKDKSGFLERNELKELLRDSGEASDDEAIDELLDSADTNGDGRIDLGEIAKKMQSACV